MESDVLARRLSLCPLGCDGGGGGGGGGGDKQQFGDEPELRLHMHVVICTGGMVASAVENCLPRCERESLHNVPPFCHLCYFEHRLLFTVVYFTFDLPPFDGEHHFQFVLGRPQSVCPSLGKLGKSSSPPPPSQTKRKQGTIKTEQGVCGIGRSVFWQRPSGPWCCLNQLSILRRLPLALSAWATVHPRPVRNFESASSWVLFWGSLLL